MPWPQADPWAGPGRGSLSAGGGPPAALAPGPVILSLAWAWDASCSQYYDVNWPLAGHGPQGLTAAVQLDSEIGCSESESDSYYPSQLCGNHGNRSSLLVAAACVVQDSKLPYNGHTDNFKIHWSKGLQSNLAVLESQSYAQHQYQRTGGRDASIALLVQVTGQQ